MKAQFGGESEGRGGGAGWWENGIRARLKGAGSRCVGGGGWEVGGWVGGGFMEGLRGTWRNNWYRSGCEGRNRGQQETRATGGRMGSGGDEWRDAAQAFLAQSLRDG